MIKSIKLKNLLSFGDPGLDLELKPLNVLIGPNGSGKSNLIDAISLLQAAPRDIAEPIRLGGGINAWLNKIGTAETAEIVATVEMPRENGSEPMLVEHGMTLAERQFATSLDSEWLRVPAADTKPLYMSVHDRRSAVPYWHPSGSVETFPKHDSDRSALAWFRGSEIYAIDRLAREYEGIRIYRDWSFGRHTAARQPQRADARNDYLAEDASNLGLILNGFREKSAVKKKIKSELRYLIDGVDDFDVTVRAGTVQLFLEEYGQTIPSTRLSDGTLRYLVLLAVLCDPAPPRVVCIEEPELGLHPDLLPHIARLMIEASERCQIIATTHSDVIVDALTEHADAVIVCERGESGSTMRRLDTEQLKPWLETYRLGQLWSKGELGGNRW